MLVSEQSLQDIPTGILLLLPYVYGGTVKKKRCVYLSKFGTKLLFQFLGLLITQRGSYKFIVNICRGFKTDDVSVCMFSQIIFDISTIKYSPATIVLVGFQEHLSASVNK